MLRTESICVSYGDSTVLKQITFQVSEGEFFGIIGPNGAGKTTLLKVITGIKQPACGDVFLDRRSIFNLSRRQIARIMAVVPQGAFIPPLFTVEDVVILGRYPHQRNRFDFAGTGYEDLRISEEAMKETNTLGLRHRLVNELSGGERQEVIIARALAQEPKILLLDEPTANLDIKHQIKILGLIKRLVKGKGITAVMIIHDLNLAARFCDRLILLHNKNVHSIGIPQEVITPQNLRIAYEVEAEVEYNRLIDSLQVLVMDEKAIRSLR